MPATKERSSELLAALGRAFRHQDRPSLEERYRKSGEDLRQAVVEIIKSVENSEPKEKESELKVKEGAVGFVIHSREKVIITQGKNKWVVYIPSKHKPPS